MTPQETTRGRRKFQPSTAGHSDLCPQLLTVALNGPLFFGSLEAVEKSLKRIRKTHHRQKHWVFTLKTASKIDLAGADFLIDLIRELKQQGGSLRIVVQSDTLIKSLHRLHVIEELGEGMVYTSKHEAVTDATNDLDKHICKGCLREVFQECDALRDAELID